MAIIPQQTLFGWEEVEELGDLQRLQLVLATLPDEPLMNILEQERRNGRNDYPVRGIWNSMLAGVVFQHPSIESLRRELLRNGQLRALCGLESGVPTAWAYTRFSKKLLNHSELVSAIFEQLVRKLHETLPGFGQTLAVDGKAIRSHGRPVRDKETAGMDGRRDSDADWGAKSYRGIREDGSAWEKVNRWFGYKLHLVVDTTYELPVAWRVTKASQSEVVQAHGLFEDLQLTHPDVVEGCHYFLGDKGYDDEKLITRLWDSAGIKTVIDIRKSWKDGEKTRLLKGQDRVVYDYSGTVSCYCMKAGLRAMAYGGFEKDRGTLKYRCPAKHYGISCESMGCCTASGGIRVSLEENRRIFTPLARSSYKWTKKYRERTAVERVNSRLDVSFGFEHHYIRGMDKMKMRCGLALCVMMAMALGRLESNQADKLRSLVCPA